MTMSISDLLTDTARKFPELCAIIGPDGRISYSELDRRATVVARALIAADVEQGARVGICAGNSVDWAVLFYGISRAGAVCVPVNTRLKDDEIAYQLEKTGVSLLFLADKVLNADLGATLARVARGLDVGLPQADLPDLRAVVMVCGPPRAGARTMGAFLDGAKAQTTLPLINPGDSALIQFTSGTTSRPKGAVLSHGAMTRNAAAVAKRMGLAPGERYLSARPFFHVAGTTLSILLSAAAGATLVTMLRFDPAEVVRLLKDEACSHFSGNDTMFLMLLDQPGAQAASHLRGGWAAAGPEIMRRAMDELGARKLIGAYGLSEAAPNVAAGDHQDTAEDRANGWLHIHDGLELRIAVPETGEPKPADTPGEIQLRGWSLMKGYFDAPEETASAFTADGFLRTGDLGMLRADGRLRFLGRLKEIIRVGGENVAPQEIESVLLRHPDIAQAQVFAVPDPRLIEVPAAYVIAREGRSPNAEALRDWVAGQIAAFKAPRYVAVVSSYEDFGMTASNKVQKAALAKDAIRRFDLTVR